MNGLVRKMVAVVASFVTMSGSILAASAEESAWVSLRIQLLSGTNPEVVAEEAISVGEPQSLSVTDTSFNRDDFEDLILGLNFGDDSDKSWDDVQVMDITVSSIVLNDNIEMMTESQSLTLSDAAGTGFKLGSLVDINSDKWLEPTETGEPSSSYITVESMTVTFTVTDFSMKTESTTTTTETTTTTTTNETTTTTTTTETTTTTTTAETTTTTVSSLANETTTSASSTSSSSKPSTTATTKTTTVTTKATTKPNNGSDPPATGDSGVGTLFVLTGTASLVAALSYTLKRKEQNS